MNLRKHQHVTYYAPAANVQLSAIVRRVHTDATVTIEARHVLDDRGGIASPTYLGLRYRVPVEDLKPASSGVVLEFKPRG